MADEKPVRIFVMGENRWRMEDSWPLERAVTTNFYLHSGGRANTLNGDGSLSVDAPGHEPPDVFAYNPLDPAPTRGGGLCCDPAFMMSGAYDQRPIEARPDVLVYSTPELERDTEVTGPVTVTLYAASSAVDTDFTAKLVDVEPCGCARNLTDGIIRARYRKPRQPASLIQPGEVYEYAIDIWATSNVFKKGAPDSAGDFQQQLPSVRPERQHRRGHRRGDAAGSRALQTVFHDGEYPSHVSVAAGAEGVTEYVPADKSLTFDLPFSNACAKLAVDRRWFRATEIHSSRLASVMVGLAAFVGACVLVYSTTRSEDGDGGWYPVGEPPLIPPQWTPDGTKIVFDSWWGLYLIDVSSDATTLRKIVAGGQWERFYPHISPDGSQMVFSTQRYEGDEITLR